MICSISHNDAEYGSLGATCLGKIGRPGEIFSTGNPATFPCLQAVSAGKTAVFRPLFELTPRRALPKP
jgi:hypothetical protein